jgi:hypothetical protein
MTKAAPEPDGPRTAWCRHCEEQIRQERRGQPWRHIDQGDGDQARDCYTTSEPTGRAS